MTVQAVGMTENVALSPDKKRQILLVGVAAYTFLATCFISVAILSFDIPRVLAFFVIAALASLVGVFSHKFLKKKLQRMDSVSIDLNNRKSDDFFEGLNQDFKCGEGFYNPGSPFYAQRHAYLNPPANPWN